MGSLVYMQLNRIFIEQLAPFGNRVLDIELRNVLLHFIALG